MGILREPFKSSYKSKRVENSIVLLSYHANTDDRRRHRASKYTLELRALRLATSRKICNSILSSERTMGGLPWQRGHKQGP